MNHPITQPALFTLGELQAVTQGTWLSDQKKNTLSLDSSVLIITDSRTLKSVDEGQAAPCFLPLCGERFNGHAYITEVFSQFDQKAIAALAAEKEVAHHPEWQGLPNILVVPDPLTAYLEIARCHRSRMSAKVVALTGSSGKTTTKEMLYAAFSPLVSTQKTEKNHNNEVGVSQTLLSLQPETQLMIVEMGMRGPDQIRPLAQHALPDIALITNIGPAHIGLLGSMEAIAKAKCEIFEGLSPETGIGVIDGDDPLLEKTARAVWKGKLLSFSLQQATNIQCFSDGGIGFTYEGHPVRLLIPGLHQVKNALAVLTVGKALGFNVAEMIQGLASFLPEAGRWKKEPFTGFENSWLINDAYNANPASMKASIDAFLQQEQNNSEPSLQKILILGGMKELGKDSQFYHQQLGEWLSGKDNIQAVFVVGEEAFWVQEGFTEKAGFYYDTAPTVEALAKTLKTAIEKNHINLSNSLILLKGSRAYQLEALPELIKSIIPSSLKN